MIFFILHQIVLKQTFIKKYTNLNLQIQVKCSNSGVEPEMLARVRSVNVAWELYIGTLGKTSRTLGHGNLVKLLVLPIIADFQFLASFFFSLRIGKADCLVIILH